MLVEGMGVSRGMLKVPLISPAKSGVRVATTRAAWLGSRYVTVTEGVEAAPILVLSAGNPLPVTLTMVPGLPDVGLSIRVRGTIITSTVAVRPAESVTVSG